MCWRTFVSWYGFTEVFAATRLTLTLHHQFRNLVIVERIAAWDCDVHRTLKQGIRDKNNSKDYLISAQKRSRDQNLVAINSEMLTST